MREVDLEEIHASLNDDEVAELYESMNSADWKENPESVMETISKALTPFGLEIVQYNDGGDTYWFKIEKITEDDDA